MIHLDSVSIKASDDETHISSTGKTGQQCLAFPANDSAGFFLEF